MKAQWENEKNAIGRVQQLRERIESLNREIEAAQQNYDLEKAAKLMYGDLPEAKKQLEHEEKLAQSSKESSLLRNKVTEEEIARIIFDSSSSSFLRAASSISIWMILRLMTSSSVGMESISVRIMAQASSRESPRSFGARAAADRRVPWHSGQMYFTFLK